MLRERSGTAPRMLREYHPIWGNLYYVYLRTKQVGESSPPAMEHVSSSMAGTKGMKEVTNREETLTT